MATTATSADHGGNSTPPSTASGSRLMSRETSSSLSSNRHHDLGGTAQGLGGGGVLLPDIGVGGGGRGDRANSLAEPPPCHGRSSAGVTNNDAATGGLDRPPPGGVRINDGGASNNNNINNNNNLVPHSPGVSANPSSPGAVDANNSSSAETISYSAERIIGNGSFGVVFQASVVETGEIVAIKKVLQDKRFKNRELQIMRQLVKDGHSNIVGLKHCFYSQVRELFVFRIYFVSWSGEECGGGGKEGE